MTSKLFSEKQNVRGRSFIDSQIILDEKTSLPQLFSRRVLEQRYVIPIGKILPFYEQLAKGKLAATTCKVCGATYFPPRADCAKCGNSEMVIKILSNQGTLLSFTRIYVKPSSFGEFPDYTVGVARLREGVNVLCWIRETDPEKIRVGMKIVVKIQKRPEDGALEYYIRSISRGRK